MVDPVALAAAWRRFLDQLATQGGDALVVTSNGVARFALAGFGQPLLAKLRTGAFGVVTLANGTARLEAWDQRPGV
jgi:probable phosphoglycerate mutase